MFIEVDGSVPEEPDCIQWSTHNQLAICTLRTIHLITPVLDKSNSVLGCQRGFITYEQYFPDDSTVTEELEKLAADKREPYLRISWSCRRRTKVGFKKLLWWPLDGIDRLVVMTFSGEILILQCSSIKINEGRNWNRIQLPAIEEVSKKRIITEINANEQELCICDEAGAVLRFDRDGHIRRQQTIPLLKGELIIRFFATTINSFIVVTSGGRIMVMTGSSIEILIDDGVLLPGPITRIADDRIIITKFNRVYIIEIDKGNAMHITLPSLDGTITVIIQDVDNLLIATSDSQWYSMNLHNSAFTIVNLRYPPWKYLPEVTEDEEKFDEDVEDMIETQDGEANNVDQRNTINGYYYYDGLGWIIETEHRIYPIPDKSAIHLYRSNHIMESFMDTSERAMFANLILNTSTQFPVHRHVASLSKGSECHVCQGPLHISPANDRICVCSNGHFYEICTMTGAPIQSLTQTIRCLRCHRATSNDCKVNRCICGGILLSCLAVN